MSGWVPTPTKATEEWTVFVQEADGGGTIHIQSYKASSSADAAEQALGQVSIDWNQPKSDLHVLGIAKGNVGIVEWDDLGT